MSQNNYPKLHNATWPGIVGKGPDSEPIISFDDMLQYTAAAEVNGVKFDGGQLSENEKALRNYYSEVLNFTRYSPALMGEYMELHSFNRTQNPAYTDKVFAFARWDISQKLIVVTNFDEFQSVKTTLKLSTELLKAWNLEKGEREIQELALPLAIVATDIGNCP